MTRRSVTAFPAVAMAMLVATADADTLDRVRANARAVVLATPTQLANGLAGAAAADLKSLRPDGSFADVDYADASPAQWKANHHLLKLERIARAYYGLHDGPADVPARLATSLGWWLDHDPKNSNWWFNQISTPRGVAYVLTMMGDDAPPPLRTRAIPFMARAVWQRQTGANLVDETWIQVLRGCIAGSPDVVAEGFARTWQELRIVGPTEEGIQADGSFHQHGPLLYNEGYGRVLLEGVTRFLAASAGTTFGPTAEARDAVDRFAIDGDAWMFRDRAWDWSVCGRSITRPGAVGDLTSRRLLADLASYPSPRAAELTAALAYPGPVGNRHFWCSDYMVQRRPDYFASVRMYSTRTANTDALTNGENRRSHHIADGATCLMVRGDEYLNIFPAWDWHRIPGTTVEQNTPFPPNKIKRTGRSDFVGGCSDGSVGCAAMDLSHDALSARKAWFCFDRAILCLGDGIDCDTPNPVATTLNQCLLHGPVESSNGPLSPGDHRLNSPRWLWHDGIGYVLPTPATLELKVGPQTGAWTDIGVGSDKPVTRDVFNLAIDHGPHVHDGRYAYVLMPGATAQQTAAAATRLPVEIVANTAKVQAAWDPAARVLQAVFHELGALAAGDVRVAVDQPCLLLVRSNADRSVVVSVSSPLPGVANVNVSMGGRSVRIDLPKDLAGSTVSRTLPAR